MSPSSPNVGENISQADTEVVPAWKQELNERLAATRSRRLRIKGEQVALPGLEHMERKVESRASRLAAKVAQRYANAPSYSEVFAAKTRSPGGGNSRVGPPRYRRFVAASLSCESWNDSLLDAELISGKPGLGRAWILTMSRPRLRSAEEPEETAVEPLAVNLIDFPRELVAARKVRPRLAEGPLRESSQQSEHDQLKIFEVAPESISQTVRIGPTGAEWSPIRLDNNRVSTLPGDGQSPTQENPLKAAPLEDRLMAGIFDLALVVAAFALFVLVFVACTAHPPTGKPALLARRSGARRVLPSVPIPVLQVCRGHPGNALREDCAVHLRGRKPNPRRHVPEGVFLAAFGCTAGVGFCLGVVRSGSPGMA